jgi:hypothetical protein
MDWGTYFTIVAQVLGGFFIGAIGAAIGIGIYKEIKKK